MKVYRYLCEEEYNDIMYMRFDKLGKAYENGVRSNTFKYKHNERYLHFFKNKDSMEQMRAIYFRDEKEYYFCTFDIPFSLLLRGSGFGFYLPRRGYDSDFEAEREYIVKTKYFSPKWLIDAELDKAKHNFNEAKRKARENGEMEPEIY